MLGNYLAVTRILFTVCGYFVCEIVSMGLFAQLMKEYVHWFKFFPVIQIFLKKMFGKKIFFY